ncbi:MAG: OB-fold domain-containing protein, partial [Gammaproteobacteria bacterium]|nr:OB-fold domain-containing protein [Gammaproteobacteria bacterium]
MAQPNVLSQAFELGFTYTRSTGPVVGRFLTGLRERRILGIRTSDGRVVVPPMEYDPNTAEALTEFVEVGQQGTIVSWCWVRQPRAAHPLQQPFAWAMIQLDGADVPMIHCVAAAAEQDLATGARVQAAWADETRGFITDIRCFELAGAKAPDSRPVQQDAAQGEEEAVTRVETPIYLHYNFTAGRAPARFLARVKEGVLTGQRCPRCANVYIPPRGSCPACGVATEEEVVLPDKGTVQSFTVVAIPIPNNPIKPPFVIANLV